jgi:hypothetical protein
MRNFRPPASLESGVAATFYGIQPASTPSKTVAGDQFAVWRDLAEKVVLRQQPHSFLFTDIRELGTVSGHKRVFGEESMD